MLFQRPLVLLLGGLLSASGFGCSAMTAAVSDSRPAGRSEASVENLVAIGRVFENQGRYDQAEAMYRRALKQNPGNSTVQNQLQQLADRRNGRSFGSDPVRSAIARADAVSSPGIQKRKVAETLSHGSLALSQAASPVTPAGASVSSARNVTSGSETTEDIPRLPSVEVGRQSPVHFAVGAVSTNDSHNMDSVVEIRQVSSGAESYESSDSVRKDQTAETDREGVPVTADEIFAVADTAADHSELLLRGLSNGDTLETQCLAAILLGDCPPENMAVRDALVAVNLVASDPRLRLAICDSRIRRGEHDDVTGDCLAELIEQGSSELQVYACTSLYHFAGRSSEAACLRALETAISSNDAAVRSAGAVALGDFPNITPNLARRLQELAETDVDTTVRDSAGTALARHAAFSTSAVPMQIRPRSL